MLSISQRAAPNRSPDTYLELPYEARCRSRFRATLASGEEAAVVMARGQVLRGGDLLLSDEGRVIEVRAAAELVSTVQGSAPAELLRAAYHLGNRHVALQVGDGWLRYLHDHVLDDMVLGLGLSVQVEEAPFEPEPGAYAQASGGHAHGGAHDHGA